MSDAPAQPQKKHRRGLRNKVTGLYYADGKWVHDHHAAQDSVDWTEPRTIGRKFATDETELVLQSEGFDEVVVPLSTLVRLNATFS